MAKAAEITTWLVRQIWDAADLKAAPPSNIQDQQ